jgi:hypothetical protein
MARISLHTRNLGETTTMNQEREFARVPAVGEHLSVSANPPWYRVTGVMHYPSEDGGIDGEVFAIEVDHHQTLKSFFSE